MNNRKGLSQVLSLIVAASVLMMTALTITFMVTSGLGGFFSGSTATQCTGPIEAQCGAGATTVDVPNACYNDNNEKIDAAPGWVPSSGDYTCGSSGNGP